MEYTKGELDAIGATIYRKQTYIGGCAGYFEKTALSDDVNEANAKEIARRWNAFEDGGIIEELRTALELLLDSLNFVGSKVEQEKKAKRLAKAALAKS